MPTTGTVAPWRDTKEAAEHLRTTPGNLAQLRYQGRGPKYHKAGSKVLYKVEDLDAWITGEAR